MSGMSMHSDVMRTFNEDVQCPPATDGDKSKAAFHFTIDGQEFIAINREMWSEEQNAATVEGSVSRDVLGEIVTSLGGYVVLADDTPVTTEPNVADLLSRRELQVALLVADGRCDKEIARQLAISIYTVREHLRRIFAKLNVCRRTAIIARVLKRRN
jgi:DNA-binding NarL/FixJ family response regulator